MKKISQLLFFLFLLFSSGKITSQKLPDYMFRTFSPDGGLGYSGISTIKQDQFGFIWILMRNELFRFDGYTFKPYSEQLRKIDPNSFKWLLNSIEEDASGNLYLGTANGLFFYDRNKDFFVRLLPDYITGVKKDKYENLWIVNGAGVSVYNPQKRALKTIEPNVETARSGTTVLCTDNNELLMSKERGKLYRFSYQHKKFHLFYTLPVINDIVDLKRMGNTLLILTVNQGLWILDLKTLVITEKYTFFCQTGHENMPAKALFIDKNKNIWIGTQKGLYLLNHQTGNYTLYTRSDADFFSLTNNSIQYLNQDRQGNMWIGTYSGGICYVNFDEASRFKTISVKSSNQSRNVISALVEKGDAIWIGTEGSGLFCYNKITGIFKQFKQQTGSNSLAYDNIKTFMLQNNQKLWIGMYRGGLDCLDLRTGKFTNYTDHDTHKRILDDDIVKLEAEADSGMWICYQNLPCRITYFSFNRNISKHYTFNHKDDTQFVGSIIKDFIRDNENNLWIATHERLHVLNVKNGKIHVIPIDNLSNHNLNSLNIETLFWDSKNHCIWIGTINNGLINYKLETGSFEYFPEILNSKAHTINSISADNQNNLWLGTDNGLFKFDTKRKMFSRFDKKDGLQGHIFYPKSSMKSSSGELYFGGTEGFSIINPNNIKNYTFRPQIIITDFLIDNNKVTYDSIGFPLKDNISITSEIKLKHTQQNFGFEFSSTNYIIPEKTRFKYRLNGYDTHWIEVDATRRYASYAKVPAGNYIFEIMATNNDGVWSDSYKQIKIRVLPAPWNSWWAYVLYSVFLFTVIFLILDFYTRNKRLKIELYLESREMKRNEENHQAQLLFFTNISHEFKTPLTLILGTLERLKQEAVPISERYFALLGNNAKRLLNMITELMDFQTVENGKMSLKISKTSLNDFVVENASDFIEHGAQRNIDFRIICDDELNHPVCFDQQLVEKIIMNLLNNAFKYTNDGGSIEIETIIDHSTFNSKFPNSFLVNKKDINAPMFGIVVRDTGIGISAESINKVFDRFYIVNDPMGNSHIGSGVGLALVKSLVTLHKGYICINSERERGTEIIVAFPNSEQEYTSSEFKEDGETEMHSGTTISSPKVVFPSGSELNSEMNDQPENFYFNEKKRILLAEDNDDLRSLIAETLVAQFEVVEACNGKIASELLHKKEYDLIISDIMMPLKDGVTFCKEVKEDISTSHIPFIMMTAKGGLENRIEGINSGADAYLEKPINFKVLQLTILNLFKLQNRTKEFYAKNFYAESNEINTNQRDNEFMKQLVSVIESKINESTLDINYLAVELAMSRSKLYAKVKNLTGKSIVEFIRYYRLRKAVRLLVDENLPIRDVMERVGIESQSYFTRAFKKEFGENPSTFVTKAKQK